MMRTEPGTDLLLPDRASPKASIASGIARLLQLWWVAFAGSVLFVVSGHLLIKAGLNALVPRHAGAGFTARVLHAALQPWVAGGLVIYLLGTICWMKAVSRKDISFVYPLSSVNYVLVAIGSTMFFHETMSAQRVGGVLIIVFGMILMNRQSGEMTP